MKYLENSEFVVGRPGLEPGTYGLKGPRSIGVLSGVFRAAVRQWRQRSPRVDRFESALDEWSLVPAVACPEVTR